MRASMYIRRIEGGHRYVRIAGFRVRLELDISWNWKIYHEQTWDISLAYSEYVVLCMWWESITIQSVAW
jgi:hypothetical protein